MITKNVLSILNSEQTVRLDNNRPAPNLTPGPPQNKAITAVNANAGEDV